MKNNYVIIRLSRRTLNQEQGPQQKTCRATGTKLATRLRPVPRSPWLCPPHGASSLAKAHTQ
eukprot:1452389-Heterocapsa_arctica.AAC.1